MTTTVTDSSTQLIPAEEFQRLNRLSVRIARLFSIIILLAMLSIGSLFALATLRGLRNETLTRQQLNAASAAAQVEFFLQQRRTELSTLGLANNNDLAEMAQDLERLLAAVPSFQEIIVVDTDGDIVGGHSRDALILQNLFALRQSQWFREALSGVPYLGTLQISSNDEPYAILAQPILTDGNVVGVIASRLDMGKLWEVVDDIPVGQTGQAYILDASGALIAHGDAALVLQGINLGDSEDLAPILNAPIGSSAIFKGFSGERVYGATANPEGTNFVVITELPAREAEGLVRETAVLLVLITLATLVATFVVGRVAISRMVDQPVSELAATAEQLGQGNLNSRAAIKSKDELGLLGDTFNLMASSLQEMLNTLETRVQQRTRDLELTMEISSHLSSILDQEQLIESIVAEIDAAFGYYHTQVYLYDDAQNYLVLVGGTGEAGQHMVASGHKIEYGQGLVGRAAASATPVLVADVSQAQDWLPNPLLPETKSEMAVPIAAGDQVIGVLDVQQNSVNGLLPEDTELLKSVANQAAVALTNVRLYRKTQSQARQETLLRSINEKITGANDMETAMKTAVRELGQALGTPQTIIRLGHHDPARSEKPTNGSSLSETK